MLYQNSYLSVSGASQAVERLKALLILFPLLLYSVLAVYVFPCQAEEYEVEIVSVETGRRVYGMWWKITRFAQKDTFWVKVTLRNNTPEPKSVKIAASALDTLHSIFCYMAFSTVLPAATEKTYYLGESSPIPQYVVPGVCEEHVSIEKPDGTAYSSEAVTKFTVYPYVEYSLTIEMYTNYGAELNLPVYIDGDGAVSPTTKKVIQGERIVKTPKIFLTLENNGRIYQYVFRYWEDKSPTNIRRVSVYENTTIKAYYIKFPAIFQMLNHAQKLYYQLP